jgi:hypothetical protein
MAITELRDVDRALLRELAAWGREEGPVLTLVMDLDPRQFATAEGRASEISSLVDRADGLVEGAGLEREQGQALRDQVSQARDYLEAGDYVSGARGVALYARAGGAELRPVRLERAAASRVALDRWPLLAPLAREEAAARWSVLLVDQRRARLLRGDRGRLEEVAELTDDERETPVQGDLSEEVKRHLDRTAEALRVAHERSPLGALLIGGQRELLGDVEARLPGELSEPLAGRFEVDVEAHPEEVLGAAGPAMDEHAERLVEEALDRMRTASSQGTGALGLEDVLKALVEARVETLLVEDDLATPGVECPACGWLGPPGRESCPADGTPTERREDVIEAALGRLVEQDAALVSLHEREDLQPFGGIGAVLRF